MSEKLEEFKEFVKKHPLLKDEVRNKKASWQSIYEEWYIDSSSDTWNKYQTTKTTTKKTEEKASESVVPQGEELLKGIMAYVKKINPDSVNKTIDSIQKVIGLIGGISGKGAAAASKKTMDPLFDRKFDDWY